MEGEKYILTEDFNSPKQNLGPQEAQAHMFFEAGSIVEGESFRDDSQGLDLLIVDEVFPIPMSILKKENELTPSQKTAGEEFKEEFERIKSTNLVHNVITKSKNSVSGMVIGAGAGLVFGALTKRSILWCSLFGGILGGIAGHAWGLDIGGAFKKMKGKNKPKETPTNE